MAILDIMRIAVLFIIIGIVSAYVFEYNKKFHDKSNLLKNVIVNGFIIVGLLLCVYLATEHIRDFLYIILYISFVIALVIVFQFMIEKMFENRINILAIEDFMSWVIIFFIISHINRHLVNPLPHIWVFILSLSAIRKLYRENHVDKKNIYKILAANILGGVFVIFLFNYYLEPYRGTSKQQYVVRKYIIENEGYQQKDIVELYRLSGKEKQNFAVFVKMKGGKCYIYYYRDGVVQNKKEI